MTLRRNMPNAFFALGFDARCANRRLGSNPFNQEPKRYAHQRNQWIAGYMLANRELARIVRDYVSRKENA